MEHGGLTFVLASNETERRPIPAMFQAAVGGGDAGGELGNSQLTWTDPGSPHGAHLEGGPPRQRRASNRSSHRAHELRFDEAGVRPGKRSRSWV